MVEGVVRRGPDIYALAHSADHWAEVISNEKCLIFS